MFSFRLEYLTVCQNNTLTKYKPLKGVTQFQNFVKTLIWNFFYKYNFTIMYTSTNIILLNLGHFCNLPIYITHIYL